MNVVYYDLMPQPEFESFVNDYSKFLVDHGEVIKNKSRFKVFEYLIIT